MQTKTFSQLKFDPCETKKSDFSNKCQKYNYELWKFNNSLSKTAVMKQEVTHQSELSCSTPDNRKMDIQDCFLWVHIIWHGFDVQQF